MDLKVSLTLKQKLFVLFVLIGLVPFLAIGAYSYITARNALIDAAFRHRGSTKDLKKANIEQYFRQIRYRSVTFAEDIMVVDAMKEFTAAFFAVEKESGAKYDANAKYNEDLLMARYQEQKEKTPDVPDNIIATWWPKKKAVKILQHQYISANPFRVGAKQNLDFAAADNSYSSVHKKYQRIFRQYVEKFGYYDMFLIEPDTGYIVYTTMKELDFGTSLMSGPYSDTNLARAFDAVLKSKDRDVVKIEDYESYAPSNGASAGFIASAIYDGDKKIGVLVFQLPIDKINNITTRNKQWSQAQGVSGKTDETYIVGANDMKMNTDSRYLLQLPDIFYNAIQKTSQDKKAIERIKKYNTTINLLTITDKHIKEAAANKSAISTYSTNYLNMPVLMTASPLDIEGLNWMIVAEVAKDEALSTSTHLFYAMLIMGLITAICVVAIGWRFSRSISMPLSRSINNISTSTTEISATVEQHERTASQQSTAVNETTTTMDELSASFKQSAEQAKNAAEGADHVMLMANEGAANLNEMLAGMASLKERVEATASMILQLSEKTTRIENIANVVSDFAGETKMLAMNAAVEAVRAGEHGKGFSVVAMEIRKLAEQSKKSAEEINSVVTEIQKATNTTVMVTEESTKTVDKEMELADVAAETFGKLSSVIRSSAENIQQIFLNIQQQSAAIAQVVEAMNSINRSVKETSSGITQTKQGIQKLDEVARDLKQMV
ncbi:methyl-accepting chemotaxis protein [Candidatus Magnetominusculus dajiuhuensis]|uniref:methyl-accepting chemotaxis protein n=1 Tax=Candidatus Magnetominusculus dajiuhuensis TaxID=3137712 RepID=UPI003B42D825